MTKFSKPSEIANNHPVVVLEIYILSLTGFSYNNDMIGTIAVIAGEWFPYNRYDRHDRWDRTAKKSQRSLSLRSLWSLESGFYMIDIPFI